MAEPQHRPSKLLDIECLRAVAIAFTLLAHDRFAYATEPAWVSWLDRKAHFWGGVDLFFVISGFVISKNLIPQFRRLAGADSRARVSALLSFWLRRVYRLWPSSWLWALLSLGVVALGYREQLANTVNDVVAGMLQVYNFHAWACANGAQTCSHLVVGVYWSLALEEQFYIVLPLIFFFLGERAKWAMVALLVAGLAMSVLWPAPLGFFRWEGFCIGVLLAWVYANPTLHALIGEQLIAPLGPLTVVITWVMLVGIALTANGGITSLPYPLIAACSGVLVLLASFERNHLGVPAFLKPVLVYLGARSYSLYLIHMPVLIAFQWFSRRIPELERADTALPHLLWVGAATLVALVLAELNYRFVESRFRRPGSGVTEPSPSSLGAVAAAK